MTRYLFYLQGYSLSTACLIWSIKIAVIWVYTDRNASRAHSEGETAEDRYL